MTVKTCETCKGEGWVCEGHPNKPWRETDGGCQCGAGMPCKECNPCDYDSPPRDPPGFKVILDVKSGWRH